MPWFLPYLPNWRGGSFRFNASLTFLPYKVTFKPRPQEPKQCILRCENMSRSFTSCVMASSHRAPKHWCLSKVETINSCENWKQNLLYTLLLDSNFAPFLADAVQWLKKTKAQPLRGLEAGGDSIPLARRLTTRQKVNFLELVLGQIANYCPIISRSTLVKNSTSPNTSGKLFASTLASRPPAHHLSIFLTYTSQRMSALGICTNASWLLWKIPYYALTV